MLIDARRPVCSAGLFVVAEGEDWSYLMLELFRADRKVTLTESPLRRPAVAEHVLQTGHDANQVVLPQFRGEPSLELEGGCVLTLQSEAPLP